MLSNAARAHESRLEFENLPRHRMRERHTPGVQRLSRDPFVGHTVNDVTDERPSPCRHVHANLVRPACDKLTSDERHIA
jgi:hypothetical protein